MANKDVAAILAKDFVDLKIDQDRMTGAKELEARFRAPFEPGKPGGGIPWFAFVDADGRKLVDCTMPNGAITGYPAEVAEVEHFAKMLESARVRMTPEDVAALKKSLDEEALRLELRR